MHDAFFADVSLLRWIGIVVGLGALALSAASLRAHAIRRIDTLLLFVFGFASCLVSANPDLLTLPAELLSLGDVNGGRIILLLLISVPVLFALVLRERAKANWNRDVIGRLVQAIAVKSFKEAHPAFTPPNAVWVIVPVLNEAQNLPSVLKAIPPDVNGVPTTALVVDDGSTDASVQVAQAHGALVVSLPINSGGGAALRAGLQVAGQHDPVAIVTLDGDGQHDPAEMPRLVAEIISGKADIVIGSRRLGSVGQQSPLRRLGVPTFAWIINTLMGISITDPASGYRAMNGRIVKRLRLAQEQYHTAELIIEAAKHGCRISEVPITISARLSGKSKKGGDLFYGLQFVRTVVKTWLR